MNANDTNYSRLDYAIATFLSERCAFDKTVNEAEKKKQKETINTIVKELSASLAKGHSCIAVSAAGQQVLIDSGLVSQEQNAPLVLEQSRLYLQRYWHYETRLAQQLRYKVNNRPLAIDNIGDIDTFLDKYFPNQEVADNEVDWQREAAKKVAQQSFSIITGGPGTGKTTTVLKILALLQEIQLTAGPNSKPLMIALAAPTGKAAMRLQESLGEGKTALTCSDEIKESITDSVSTIHRLLGSKPSSPYFKHHAENPLVHDLVVIDEASMVDLALMSKLVDALKPDARLILLGDKDQLASVESGAILGDLSQGLVGHTSELKKSWRFKGEIKKLALAINQQDQELAWKLLTSEQHPSTSLATNALLPHILKNMQSYFYSINHIADKNTSQSTYENSTLENIFKAYKHFQILCSNRKGKLGVEGINSLIERSLHQQGVNTLQPWYSGKPVIITRNDPGTELFNGDIGICLYDVNKQADNEKGTDKTDLYVYFQLADGRIKKILPARLPQHETAYALTIHKSQGSEFNHILMILPENPNPVLGKELIYTAVTRAKETVQVFSSQAVFDYALSHQVERISGLKDKVQAG